MSKTKWRKLESFSQKSNKITNVQPLPSFCKVYSSLKSIISIKEIKFSSKTCLQICRIVAFSFVCSLFCQISLLKATILNFKDYVMWAGKKF